MFPYVVGPIYVSPISIAFFASSVNVGQSANIDVPASVASGDLMVLLDNAANAPGSIPAAVSPAGWSQIITQGDNFPGVAAVRTSIVYRVSNGTEGGSTITGMSSTTPLTEKVMLVFRPTGGTTWTNSGQAANNNGTGSPTIGTITAGSAPGVMICYGNNFANGSNPLTMSPAGTSVANGSARGGYIVYNSSPSNNTPTVANIGSLAGVWFTRS